MVLYRCFLHAALLGSVLGNAILFFVALPGLIALPDFEGECTVEPTGPGDVARGVGEIVELIGQSDQIGPGAEAPVLVHVELRDFADFDSELEGRFAMIPGQTQHIGDTRGGHDVWLDVDVQRSEEHPSLFVVALGYRKDGVVQNAPTLLVAPGQHAEVELTSERERRSFDVTIEPM